MSAPDDADAAGLLREQRRAIAEAVTARHFARHPELDARYGAAGRQKCRGDAEHHLDYLEQAVRFASPALFADYVSWARAMLESRGIAPEDLSDHLRSLLDEAAGHVPAIAPALQAIGAHGLALLPLVTVDAELDAHLPAQRFLAAARSGGPNAAGRVVAELLDAGMSLHDVYVEVLERAQHEIGRLWQTNRMSVAEEHYFTATTQLVIAQLYPRVFERAPTRPTVVIACVAGELHEVGARMVADLLQLEGFDTHFVGANVPIPDLVRFIQNRKARVVGLSATIAAHLATLEQTIHAIRANPATASVRIVVGGYPFSRVAALWRRVGADACAANAREAVATFMDLLPAS
jgi:methanogenic corrinoid protein MtbC1